MATLSYRGALRALTLFALPCAATGQISPTEWLPAEARANELVGAARWVQASEVEWAALAARCQRAPADDLAREGAFAEYLAVRTEQTADSVVSSLRTRARFLELARSPLAQAFPALRSVLLTAALRLGGLEQDAAGRSGLARELGIVTDWMLVGPFDNERGAGFGTSHGPEKGFEPARSYRGKKRDIRWRRLPAVPVDGRIDLGAMVRPNRQVLCYLATCLDAKSDRDVLLHLGTAEGFEVHLNGAQRAAASVRRSARFDQNHVVLPLRQGPNYLCLKILAQTFGLECLVRITDLRGRVADDLEITVAPDRLQQARATKPRDTERVPPADVVGGRAVFAAPQGRPLQPLDAYRLSVLEGYYGARDVDDATTLERLDKVATARPTDATVRLALAAARGRNGRQAIDRDDNRLRHDYEQILEHHPRHALAMMQLAELDIRAVGVTERARQLLATALALEPESRSLLYRNGLRLEKEGLTPFYYRTLQRCARLAKDGSLFTVAARTLAQAESALGQFAAARERLQLLIARENRIRDRMGLCFTLLRSGARDRAVGVFRSTILHHPLEATSYYRLSRLLEAEQDYLGALAALQSWLKICPEDDGAWIEAARIHGVLGQTEPQCEALRTAIRLNPNRKQDRRLLEYLSAGTRPFFAEFQVDAAPILAAAAKAADAPAVDTSESHDFLLRHQVVQAYRNGTTSSYHHEIVRIRNEAGARRFARIDAPHYWGEQRARLLELTVHKKDGSRRRPRLQGTSARLPDLVPGDIIDYRYRVDDTAPSFFGDMFGFVQTFGGTEPVAEQRLTLILDPGRTYQLQTVHGAPEPAKSTTADGTQIWTFAMRDLPAIAPEASRPRAAESLPLVRVSTFADWNAFSAWWWNLIKDQQQVSGPIRAKVAELTAGITSKREQIQAIYKFVTTDIRYKAWEFGVHGYKPYSTPVIFERRHGDCKDKAMLLNCMLGVIGIQAHPVLIHADAPRSRDDLSVPLVQHFNHCISFVEATDETPAMFLDGTATYHPLDTLPEMDWGAEVLVVRGARATVQKIPWPKAEENRQFSTARIELSSSGDARIDLRMQPTRNQAIWVRERLGNEPAKRDQRLADGLGREFGRVTLESVQTSDLLDLTQPVDVRVRFRVEGHATRRGNSLVLPSATATGAVSLSSVTVSESRATPLLLGVPRSYVTKTIYELPPGMKPAELPKNVTREIPAARFAMTWRLDGDRLFVERRLEILRDRIEPEAYPAFRELAAAVDEACDRAVILRDDEKRAADRKEKKEQR